MPFSVLYSLRQCPYAMRARLGILHSGQSVILRDIDMKNKPESMLTASPKGTVPVLVRTNGSVIDESIDIMFWALQQSDPKALLYPQQPEQMTDILRLIQHNDTDFIDALQQYRAASRYHDTNEKECRDKCVERLNEIEQRLSQHQYIMGETPSVVDYAILPFIRQFSRVDKKWYAQAPLPNLRAWLMTHYNDPNFSKTMVAHPKWQEGSTPIIFGEDQ